MHRFFKYLFGIVTLLVLISCGGKKENPVTKTGFIAIADSKLYYETTGEGDAIVLLHGGFMDRRMWDDQVDEFSKHYRVITCDLRGHGATTDGDSSYFMYEAIRILLDTLHEKKAIVAGLSLGAMIATDFAMVYPQYVDKLVLVTPGLNKLDTVFAQDSTIQKYSDLMVDAIQKLRDTSLAAEYFIRSWFDGPYRLPTQTDTIARKKALMMATATLKTHKFLHWTRLAEPPASQRLNSIAAPTLIIIAEKDNYRISKNAEALKNGISQSKIVTINSVAHLPNLEKPVEFNGIFLGFIKE